jgi:hypothetical protein
MNFKVRGNNGTLTLSKEEIEQVIAALELASGPEDQLTLAFRKYFGFEFAEV